MNEREMYVLDNKYVFLGLVWPSAAACKEELLGDLKQFAICSEARHYRVDRQVFSWVMQVAYLHDWIPEKVRQKKQEIICERFSEDVMSLWMVTLELCKNEIFFDEKDQRIHSLTVSTLKRKLREQYKDQIEKYVHDILFHVSDNYNQTVSLQYIDVVLSFLKRHREQVRVDGVNQCCLELNFTGDISILERELFLGDSREHVIKYETGRAALFLRDTCILRICFI